MIPEMSDLLDVRTVDGLKIYTFKSEEPLAVLVGENRFLMVMAGKYSVEQAIAEALGLSYPTVQKTVKKLRDKKIISKASIGQNSYELSAEADRFFKSISNNIQIVLTFEPVDDVQLETVNEDGTLNEEMIK